MMKENMNTKSATTNTTTETAKTKNAKNAKTTTKNIYDGIKYVRGLEFHASLADHALKYADRKICYNIRPLDFCPENRIFIITLWHQRVMELDEVIKNVKHMLDDQLDSKAETRRLQGMVDKDHLLIKTGRVHGRPILIVQLIED
jgi:hypothetical protein